MALKRKMRSTLAELSCDSSDSDVIVFKRRRINVIYESDTDIRNENTQNMGKYVRITEDEYHSDNSFDFVEKSGPQHLLPVESKPIDYFNLFFTYSLWELMVKETNRYAEQLLSTMATAKSRLSNWYPVTVLEMKAFIAVLLEMGITKKPTIYSYWTVNSRAIPWFKKMFSRNRFQNLLRCFHLVNNKNCFPQGHEK